VSHSKISKESSLSSLPLRSKETINYASDDSITNEDDIIVLDDTIEEIEPKLKKPNSKLDKNDLESLLASFDSIKIDKEKTSNATSNKSKSPKPESSSNDAYIPFSQRMKTIYKNASLFDK